MFTALGKTAILAATAFALSLGAVGTASALSLELAPGVKHEQKCFDKQFKVKKYVKVVQHGRWVIVPKHVIVTKTICKDYYTQVSPKPRVHHGSSY